MSSIHEAFPLKEFPFGLGYVTSYKKALELLEAGADPNEINQDGLNLLHLIGKCWWGRNEDDLLDFLEYMPPVLEKALPLMQDKGINQKLKTREEYKNHENENYRRWYAGCTPLHLAVENPEGKGYAHTKASTDLLHWKIKTMTWGQIDKKCKAYYEMFIIKLLDWGADRNIRNEAGEDPLEYIGGTRTKISAQNKVKKLLDKYSRVK